MVPSEVLRIKLERNYNIDLSRYAWDSDLKNLIFGFKTDPYIENKVSSLKEVYEKGLNIGHCGTTSRYLSINFGEALMHYGTLPILKGTKYSTNGSHAWVETKGYIIDPTLMIFLPIELKEKYGYHTDSVLAKSSSCVLSEYDTFSQEMKLLLSDYDAFQDGLYDLNKKARL